MTIMSGLAAPAGPVDRKADPAIMQAAIGVRAGPKTETIAPSGVHRQMRGTERVISLAHFSRGALGVFPQKG
ncbi:MAG: hypothetical protein WBA51_00460 [Erythrobacter sp.]